MTVYVRKKRQLKAEINVVPYIDVMLVLLIIFMVTSPFVTQGVEVELPKTETARLASDMAGDSEASFIIVEVDKAGRLGVSINDEDMVRGLSMSEIIARVKAERSVSPTAPVAVGGDQQTSYADIVLVLDELNKAGIEKVGLLTEIKESR